MNRKAMDKGIIVAGSMIVDNLKKIDIYPGPCNLTPIRKNEMALGGLVNNCIQDLARIDPEIPLKALGIVGDDTCGNFIFEKLGKFSTIDVSALQKRGDTSFTDVMYDSVRRTRAYFQFYGSNADLCIDDFDFDKVTGSIMHVGYMLLLDNLDQPHPVYGTKMGEVLHKAQSYGIKTSIDIVSEESDRYRTVVAPALKYVDYCIINEMEAGKIVGIPASDEDGHIIEENMPKICRALRELGVRDWIIVHARDASYGLDTDGTFIRMDCIDIPRSLIVATTGAGDAFCSGAPPHAALVLGEEGTGKRTLLNACAQSLFCEAKDKPCGACAPCRRFAARSHPDVHRIERKKSVGVDEVRDLTAALQIAPYEGGYKAAIIEDAGAMTPQAQNCLLKTLEEPPEKTVFLLAAASESKLLSTILSRCMIVRLSPFSEQKVCDILRAQGAPAERAAQLAALSGGSGGKAL